jgi:glucose/arabinose dehydrogenase
VRRSQFSAGFVAVFLAACGSSASLPVSAGTGPTPTLPPPHASLIPLVHVATAVGWAPGVKPTAAPDLYVAQLAAGLDHPRWLYVLPNNDVLVAETNAPPKPDDGKGLRGWFLKKFMKKAGAATPTANRITLLRDADGDGIAETKSVFLSGLNSPFGMTLVGSTLYVANSDAVVRFPYSQGQTRITAGPEKVVDLPAGRINHHWTKNVISSADGSKLYVTVGSNSNAGEHGIAAEEGRAAIWEVDPKTGAHRVFASGLRNPNGLAWSETGALWAAVNERDEIGSDLVPDYITSVRDGAFYGWPYSYYGQHVDKRTKEQRPDLVAAAVVPDYAIGPHTGSLGLASSRGASALPARFSNGMFVGQHGSWNRKPFSGYRVIYVPFANGKPSGDPIDVLTGFVDDDRAHGRPVGVVIDRRGALLVADDVGNVVWRVVAK